MKNLSFLALTAATTLLPTLTSAHYLFPSLILNGKVTAPNEYVREHDHGFQPSKTDEGILTSEDLRCNKGSMRHANDPKTAKVVAGKDVVGFQTNLATKIGHPGPITVHMSKAPGDVRKYDGSGDWFKVYQLGTTEPWNGTDQGWLSWNRNQFTFKMPLEIPAGQYLMRIEHMAVHQPYKNKELYMQCAHIEVESDYNGTPPNPTIKLPGGYSMNDPAIQLDSWAKPTFAPMPKPDKMWPNNDNFNKIL